MDNGEIIVNFQPSEFVEDEPIKEVEAVGELWKPVRSPVLGLGLGRGWWGQQQQQQQQLEEPLALARTGGAVVGG